MSNKVEVKHQPDRVSGPLPEDASKQKQQRLLRSRDSRKKATRR